MDVLYSSKGISKTAVTKKAISIVLCLIIMIGLIIYSQSKVKGRTHNVSLGGQFTSISFDEYRFSSSERKGVTTIGFLFGVFAIFDAATLGLSRTSWVEIRKDTVKGNFMGKTVSCAISDISNVSSYSNYLILTGKQGVTMLVAENPKNARAVLDSLLLKH